MKRPSLKFADDELASQMLAEIEMMEGIYKVSFSIFETDEAISS